MGLNCVNWHVGWGGKFLLRSWGFLQVAVQCCGWLTVGLRLDEIWSVQGQFILFVIIKRTLLEYSQPPGVEMSEKGLDRMGR